MKLKDQLHDIISDLSLIASESALIIGALLMLIVGLITKRKLPIVLIFSIAIFVSLGFNLEPIVAGSYLSKSLVFTSENVSFGSLFLLFGWLLLFFERKEHTTEFYFFVISILVGTSFMVKSGNLLLIYLAVELVSYVSYILTSFSFSKSGHEAAIKYLLFGATSSAIMLVGIGLLYGASQSLYLSEWNAEMVSTLLFQVGALLFLFGLLFKCGIVPFHIWVPATYQAGPIDAVVLFSVVPKLAGFVLLKNVYWAMQLDYTHWMVSVLLVLGVATIISGTLGAINQSNTRRMVSFGSVAHSGFLFGFVITPTNSYSDEFWLYSVIYGIMNFGAFYLIKKYESSSIHRNEEYSRTHTEVVMAVAFTLILVSLVGIPPLAGFTAKFFLFTSLWSVFSETGATISFIYLIVAVLATLVSLFFYLRVPYHLFLGKNRVAKSKSSIEFPVSAKITATIFAFLLFIFFFTPKLIMYLQPLLNNVYE